MSKTQSSKAENRECVVHIGRRSMLERVAVGGAAFVAMGFDGVAAAEDDGKSGPVQCGVLQPIAAGKIRRVVCGVNAEGKSRVVSDSVIDTGELWSTDAEQPLGTGPANEKPYAKVTSKLRSHWYIATHQPSKDPKPTLENRQGFHINPVRGVAYIFVLAGETTHLTDLEEVKLKAGDLLIMRDHSHAWRNDGTEPVKLLVAAVAA